MMGRRSRGPGAIADAATALLLVGGGLLLLLLGCAPVAVVADSASSCAADNPIGASTAASSSTFTASFQNSWSATVAIMSVATNCSESFVGNINPSASQSVAGVYTGEVFLARMYNTGAVIGSVVGSYQAASTSTSWVITGQTSSSKSYTTYIIIGAVCAVVVIGAIVGVVFYMRMRKNRAAKAQSGYSNNNAFAQQPKSSLQGTADPYIQTPSPAKVNSLDHPKYGASLGRGGAQSGSFNRGQNASGQDGYNPYGAYGGNSNNGYQDPNGMPSAPTSIVTPATMRKPTINTSKAAKRASLKWWEAPGTKNANNPGQPGPQSGGPEGPSGALNGPGANYPPTSPQGTMSAPTGNWKMSLSRNFGTLAGSGAGGMNKMDYYDITPQQAQQTSLDELPAPNAMGPGSRLRVIHACRAALEDELTLFPGDVVVLNEAYGDGWCLAKVVKSTKQGAEPGASSVGDEGMVPVGCLDVMETARMSMMPGGGDAAGGGRTKRVQSMLRPESMALFAAAGRDVSEYLGDYNTGNAYGGGSGAAAAGYGQSGYGHESTYGAEAAAYGGNSGGYGNQGGYGGGSGGRDKGGAGYGAQYGQQGGDRQYGQGYGGGGSANQNYGGSGGRQQGYY